MDFTNIQDELHLRDYINILRGRSGVVILFFITTVLVVALGTFMMRPLYCAKVTLLIDVENPNVLTASGVLEIASQNYYSYKEYYQSQKEILTSLPILQKVFSEFGLAESQDYADAKEPLKKFLKTISVAPVRDTRLLDLFVENKDTALAAKIANRIAEIYVRRNLYYISKTELLNLLKNEYLKLEAKLSEYTNIYKEGHPEMMRLRKEIEEVVDKIEREKKAVFRQDYDESEDTGYKHALEGLKANNVSILAPAEAPPVPVKPKKLMNALLAVIMGLFGGITLAFFLEYLDDTIKDPHELDRSNKWPFLGSVPKINASGKLTEFEKDIFLHIQPKDPIAETYRSIRTSIIFSATEEHPIKTIVITSPGPQEGKTTTLCNLGIAMAQNQKRILLVDADMRNPRLHEVFRKKNEAGLSTILSGQAVFSDVAQNTDINNLSLIPSGMHPPNPSELLASHKMAAFLGEVKAKFDYILLDTPPIAMLTDAVILSSISDGIVIVIDSGKTSRKILPRIHKLLTDAKARIVGVILNRISIHSQNYRYYSYYYSRKPK